MRSARLLSATFVITLALAVHACGGAPATIGQFRDSMLGDPTRHTMVERWTIPDAPERVADRLARAYATCMDHDEIVSGGYGMQVHQYRSQLTPYDGTRGSVAYSHNGRYLVLIDVTAAGDGSRITFIARRNFDSLLAGTRRWVVEFGEETECLSEAP